MWSFFPPSFSPRRIQGVDVLVVVFPIGLIFGFVYWKWRQLWPLVVAHVLFDLDALFPRSHPPDQLCRPHFARRIADASVKRGAFNIMKKFIGSILCIVAILRFVSLTILPQKPDPTNHRVQDWALAVVLLAVGISLSAGKKPQDSGKR